MADARIRFGNLMGAGAPVYATRALASQAINTTAASQVSAYTAQGGEYLTVAVNGTTAVAIDIGPSPVAVATSGDVVLGNQTRDFGPLKAGDRVALIDVA